MKLLLFLLMLVFSSQSYGIFNHSYEKQCAQITQIDLDKIGCDKSLEDILPLNLNEFPSEKQKLNIVSELVLIRELEILYDEYDDRAEVWGDFLRYLRGLKGDDVEAHKIPEFQEIFHEFGKDFAEIEGVYQAHAILKKQLITCQKLHCSIGRIRELEDQEHVLRSYFENLLISNPLLLSQKLFDHLEGKDSYTLEELLIHNLVDGFKKDREIKAMLSNFKSGIELRANHNLSTHLGLRQFKHSEAIDLVLQNAFNSWDGKSDLEKNIFCKYAEQRIDGAKKEDHIMSGANIGFFGLSLVPIFSPLRAESVIGLTLQTLGGIGRLGFTGSLLNSTHTKNRECSQISSRFLNQIDTQAYKEWKSCLQTVDYLKLSTALSAIPVNTLLKMPVTFLRIARLKGTPFGPHFQTANQYSTNRVIGENIYRFNDGSRSVYSIEFQGRTYTHLNLTQFDSVRKAKGATQIADDYLDFVGGVYSNQLKTLSPDQVASFIQTSKTFRGRTKLIVASKGPPKKDNLIGGVAAVESRKADDLLPLEKATGFRVPRNGGKDIEIVRLTSTDAGKGNMEQVLNQLAQIYVRDPNVKNIYMYTSKVHYRLYKRLGVQGEVIHSPNSKEVIVRFSPADFSNLRIQT